MVNVATFHELPRNTIPLLLSTILVVVVERGRLRNKTSFYSFYIHGLFLFNLCRWAYYAHNRTWFELHTTVEEEVCILSLLASRLWSFCRRELVVPEKALECVYLELYDAGNRSFSLPPCQPEATTRRRTWKVCAHGDKY